MKNNILRFIVYFVVSVLASIDAVVILLAIKENSDRCHYYNGEWNKRDLLLGFSAISLGFVLKFVIQKWVII